MTDQDARLESLLRETSVPAADPGFRVAVLERVARRRFRRRLALAVGAWVVASAAAGAASPALTASLSESFRALNASGSLATAGVALAILSALWGLSQLRRPI